MKKLTNLLLFMILSLALKCQEPDTLVYYTPKQWDSLTTANNDLANKNTKLQDSFHIVIDSLGLVIESLEEISTPSGSFYADTLFMTVYDSLGERIILSKLGTQVNVTVINGDIRTAVFYDTTFPEIYRMNGNVTEYSILEDVYKYRVNITDLYTTIEKRK